MNEIKVGDVVMLKSGGPAMTVTSVSDNYGTMSAWCVWFDGKREVNGVFPLVAIIPDAA